MAESYRVVLDWFAAHPHIVTKVALGSLALAVVSLGLLVVAVSRMPADYFVAGTVPRASWRDRHPLLRLVLRVLKSLAGLVLLLTGVVLLFVPGQGLLTILIGVSLLEFPGKRRLELAMARERHVLKTINWIRARAKQPPLIVEPLP
ncbi:hypothetical protein FKG94_22045 [Exilibacterium tricleocarpae]|uniref:Transmembrane protein (PGPGW) n=1 Tax=Exilibacterium tricleocarpae TaxID=2591008 RepID=A0A545SZ23_9GAMM|nr:PGPGW domain-containing protein [Exilibacterium tricleocarpae]TQV70200.1 hypothetical protein FKG94_22045 [Exilibacterium tricleocarpae]